MGSGEWIWCWIWWKFGKYRLKFKEPKLSGKSSWSLRGKILLVNFGHFLGLMGKYLSKSKKRAGHCNWGACIKAIKKKLHQEIKLIEYRWSYPCGVEYNFRSLCGGCSGVARQFWVSFIAVVLNHCQAMTFLLLGSKPAEDPLPKYFLFPIVHPTSHNGPQWPQTA